MRTTATTRMTTALLYTILVFSLLILSGCEAGLVEAAAVQPETVTQGQPIPVELAEEYRTYQAVFDAAYLEQTLFRKYEDVLVYWPDSFVGKQEITLRIQKADGRIYSERMTQVKGGSVINLGEAYVFPDGEYFVVLMPPPTLYYVGGVRAERRIPIQVQTRQ